MARAVQSTVAPPEDLEHDEPDEPDEPDEQKHGPQPTRLYGRNKDGSPTTKGVGPGMVWLNWKATHAQHDRLKAWSKRQGISMSKIIQLLVQEALDQNRDQRVGLPK